MKKPDGKWRCRACGRIWHGSELKLSPSHTAITWTCWDAFCGGLCDRIYRVVAEEKGATATFYTDDPEKQIERCLGVGYERAGIVEEQS